MEKSSMMEISEIIGENVEEEQVNAEEINQLGLFIEEIRSEIEVRSKSTTLGTRRPRKLKSAVAGLMGEANIQYASGNFNEAIKMSMEVIRNAPDSPDPFQLLAIIYEESGQFEKSVQYGLVAAFLTRTNIEEWMTVANKAINLKNYKLAHMCYEKICKLDSNNEEFWVTKCDLMKKSGFDKKKILESYTNILYIEKNKDADRYIKMARNLFMEFISISETDKAKEIMIKALEFHPKLVTKSDINLLIEVLFMQNDYETSFEILQKHCGVSIYDEIIDNNLQQNLTFQNDLPVDFLSKLLISLIHLKKHSLTETALKKLLKEDCEAVGDLYMDVGEAFMKKNVFEKAEQMFKLLVNSVKYNLPAVWLKYGEALKAQMKVSEAINVYSRVVEMAPDHVEARIILSSFYQQVGSNDQALLVLNSSVNLDNITDSDLKMLFNYCFYLENQNKNKEFIKLSTKVLTFCCNQVLTEKNKYEVSNNRMLRLRNFIYHHAVNWIFSKGDMPKKVINLIPFADQIWQLFTHLKTSLISLKIFQKLFSLTLLMVICPAFYNNTSRSAELEYICLIAGILAKKVNFSYYIVRNYIIKGQKNSRIWNVLNRIIIISQDLRYNRFCIRLAMKHPDNLALCQLNGHNALLAGSYKHALGEYFMCLKLDCLNPIHYFMIGLCYIHFVCQKFTSHRHMLTIQAVSYLNHYKVLRGNHEEVLYNLGRAMHQLGLLSHAVSFYKKVLEAPNNFNEGFFSLKREAAYNLHLIYLKTSPELAIDILHRHLIV